METIWHDVRYGLRSLARSPGFTAVVVLMLALGLGANAALFGIVRGVLLRPLPYPDPEELYVVWGWHPEIGTETASAPDFADWRAQNEVYDDLAASFLRNVTLTGDGAPERLLGTRTSASLFEVLGVRPLLGRAFLPEEDRPEAEKVAILGHGLWQRRFGGDPRIVGRTITLDGEAWTVVGVAPPELAHPAGAELWMPLRLDPASLPRRADFLTLVGRLKDGVSPEAARAEMRTIAARLEAEYPQTNAGWTVEPVPLHEELVGDVRPVLLALWGAVGFVLLIACANVSNLLSARALGRGELAVRSALGAERGRLVRQLLTETLLLFVAGAAAGTALAYGAVTFVRASNPGDLPRVESVALDPAVVAFAGALALVFGLVFGLAPALQATGMDVDARLREGGLRASESRGGRRLRNFLVVAEVALSLVLLVGAGLMVRTLLELGRVDPGFEPRGVLVANLTLPRAGYGEPGQAPAFYRALLERMRALPGVSSAAAVDDLYLTGGGSYLSFLLEGRPAPPPEAVVDAHVRSVTPGFHETLRVPIVLGEGFTREHAPDGPLVALVNQAFVRRYFPEGAPIGQRLDFSGTAAQPQWREIVGVIGDVRQEGLDREVYPEIQVPYGQRPRRSMTLVVRTEGDPAGLAPLLRAAVAALDPELPVFDVATMDAVLARSLGERRFTLLLLGLFAALALVLAAVGIYSVLSYAVGQRRREIGVRLSFGARPRDVRRMVLRDGMRLVGLGLATGLVFALFLARSLAASLHGVEPVDPLSYAVVAAILAVVALLACLLPAHRAARVDPVEAMRIE